MTSADSPSSSGPSDPHRHTSDPNASPDSGQPWVDPRDIDAARDDEIAYPKQQLLPHDVTPPPRRRTLLVGIAAVVVVLLVAGGVAAYLMSRGGDQNRGAYCAKLQTLVPNNDLVGAVSNADGSTIAAIRTLPNIAPSSVADDWSVLIKAFDQVKASGSVDMGVMAQGATALSTIIDDANANCGMSIKMPNL